MVAVKVDAAEALAMLRSMSSRIDDKAATLRLMGDLLVDFEEEVFASQGRGRWKKLHPKTVKLKGSTRIMVDTGNLLKNLTDSRIEGESAVVNEGDAYYARFQRMGSRGMPKRNPAPRPTPIVRGGWADDLLGFITDGVG